MIRLRSLPILLWLAVTGLVADAQIAPDHHWVGFADKVGCGVDLNGPEAGRQLLSRRALDRRARHGIALARWIFPCRRPDFRRAVRGRDGGWTSVQLLHRSKWFNGIVIRLDTALVDSAGAAEVLAGIAHWTASSGAVLHVARNSPAGGPAPLGAAAVATGTSERSGRLWHGLVSDAPAAAGPPSRPPPGEACWRGSGQRV